MRKVEIGWQRYTEVIAVDKKNVSTGGGANHHYLVKPSNGDQNPPLGDIKFQNGPIKEVGINGVMNEDLIAMILDRLYSFQESPFKCRENAIAITKLEEAMLWLNKRTLDRERRNVEGTHTV